ncbi:aminotransferase class I/II-fold pyridoxal phosphate-dependent enzyme [Streptomyces uncialis]|uniref:aminotransferase class I/II-fold pyridoxal phosphate-dependent enzyme n=1 Tax=Streptomyces uncialis TaxID=1048205 RepID=UPI002E376356|nr:aminotransferase class I/II-fold pyridoxal phosphate-dependent enzyme [Streptomyces uncialis]
MTADLSGPPPRWPRSARDVFAEAMDAAARTVTLWQQPAPQGDEVLREELGCLLGTDPERLTITAGVRATALTYARTKRRIALERPTFPGVLHTLRAAGADVSLHSWDELLRRPPASTLWLTSPFRNPDGRTLTVGERDTLTRLTTSGHRVIVNEAYRWFGAEPPVPGADRLGTLHKLTGHGVRLGWVDSADFFGRATAEMLGTTPSPVWQRAWGLFLRRGGLDGLIDATVAPTLTAATRFHERLGLGTAPGPHVLIRPRPNVDEETALRHLAEHSIKLSPGADFLADGPSLRASFTGASPGAGTRLADLLKNSSLFAPDLVRVR